MVCTVVTPSASSAISNSRGSFVCEYMYDVDDFFIWCGTGA